MYREVRSFIARRHGPHRGLLQHTSARRRRPTCSAFTLSLSLFSAAAVRVQASRLDRAFSPSHTAPLDDFVDDPPWPRASYSSTLFSLTECSGTRISLVLSAVRRVTGPSASSHSSSTTTTRPSSSATLPRTKAGTYNPWPWPSGTTPPLKDTLFTTT